MNPYALLADLIAAIHLGYVSFVFFGLLVILTGGLLRWRFVRNFWFRTVHLAMILIVVAEALLGIICPLTVWEYNLRVAAGQQDVSDVTVYFFSGVIVLKLLSFCHGHECPFFLHHTPRTTPQRS
jgi:hypothetical protein